jgi:hypothetical protein
MKHCHTCGHVISGRAVEITPDSDSGTKPTLYRHKTLAECKQAKTQAT